INPQIIEGCDGCVWIPTSLQMCTLDCDNACFRTMTGQNSDPLCFVKLHPEWVSAQTSRFAESEISVACNLRDCESRSIDSTCNHPARTAASFAKDQIT